MINMAIIENKTKKVVANYKINWNGNYTVFNNYYISEAWRCAVEDDLVNAEDRIKYNIVEIIEDSN